MGIDPVMGDAFLGTRHSAGSKAEPEPAGGRAWAELGAA
jgi:hypothetical protein